MASHPTRLNFTLKMEAKDLFEAFGNHVPDYTASLPNDNVHCREDVTPHKSGKVRIVSRIWQVRCVIVSRRSASEWQRSMLACNLKQGQRSCGQAKWVGGGPRMMYDVKSTVCVKYDQNKPKSNGSTFVS